ncbi:MAG TPA: hypothetical protein VHG93_23055 [Longimicrobium sp.]|nr:hypothetical protein [Longimicrobium sp.]
MTDHMTEDRRSLLMSLLRGERPTAELRRELARHPWDCESPLVTLEATHVRGMTQRFVDGLISARDLEDWADALELREDIDMEAGKEDLLRETIQRLANPELYDPLTRDHAADILREMDEVA